MSQKIVLPRDIRVFKKYQPQGNALYRAEAFIEAGSKIEIGDIFEAGYDHRRQYAAPVLGHDCDGEEVFILIEEIGNLNSLSNQNRT